MRLPGFVVKAMPDFIRVNHEDLTEDEREIRNRINECRSYSRGNDLKFSQTLSEIHKILKRYHGKYLPYFRSEYNDILRWR